jgi:polysaccharide export outer membrane protein
MVYIRLYFPMNKTYFVYLIFTLLLSSCGVYNSNKILSPSKTPNYSIETFNGSKESGIIQAGDKLSIKIFPNEGERALLTMASIKEDNLSNTETDGYLVSQAGKIKLPLIGDVHTVGLTTDQLADSLVTKLKKTIQAPYVEVNITNQRVLLFNGNSTGQVIPLANEGTTLAEVLALGGGIKEFGKSNEIRLFRKENGVRKIYEFDLSEINQLKNADITIQNRDILVINHHPRSAQNSLREVGPWLSILTSGLAIFSIFSKI